MKPVVAFLLMAIIGSAIQCNSSKNQIIELHRSSIEKSEAFEPMLEELVQSGNSINVQGRALTPEEIEFTDMVQSLESVYYTWQQDMEAIEDKPMGKDRLKEEKLLNEAIDSFAQIAETIDDEL